MWRATVGQIGEWLQQEQPDAAELLLIGASAGWMLPAAWLTRFKRLYVWDTDPLAALAFRWRHGAALDAAGISWRYQTGDAIAALPQLLQQHPGACVFFDNVLGQLRFQNRKPLMAEHAITRIRQLMKGREWGSIHDLLSGPVSHHWHGQTLPGPRVRQVGAGDGAPGLDWMALLGPQGEWLDHLTGSVFEPGVTVRDMAWPFRADYWHWLEAGWVRPLAGKTVSRLWAAPQRGSNGSGSTQGMDVIAGCEG